MKKPKPNPSRLATANVYTISCVLTAKEVELFNTYCKQKRWKGSIRSRLQVLLSLAIGERICEIEDDET
jgi:hypothetical protein